MAFIPPTFGTSTALNPALPDKNKADKERINQNKINCISKGGTWDPVTNTCNLPLDQEADPYKIKVPETITKPDEAPKVDAAGVETFGDVNTGRASGVTINGKTYLGLGPDDVNLIAEGEARRTARPEGTAPVGTAQRLADEQFQLQQSIKTIGQVGQLGPAEQAAINWGQAITAGLSNVVPAAAGGAAIGAAAGVVGSAGALSAPAAVAVGAAGAVAGFVRGVQANIKEQQSGELKAADIELTNARTLMRQFAMLATRDPSNADYWIQQYNNQLTRVHQSRRQTHAEVQGNLNSFMEDGREQLADFDAFLQDGGIASVYGDKLSVALTSGVPLSVIEEDLI